MPGPITGGGLTSAQAQALIDASIALGPVEFGIALSDETTALTGGLKARFRAPFAFTITQVRAGLTSESTSGPVEVVVRVDDANIFSTNLTIDQGELTSTTADIPAVLGLTAVADDSSIKFEIQSEGVDAAGLKVWLIGHRI